MDQNHHAGFWCPDCDGFTGFDAKSDARHRMLLFLEQRKTMQSDQILPELPQRHLKKRLSPLRYPGGKSKVIDWIYRRLQADKVNTFVEVFAGGASLGLSLLDSGTIKRLVLNDLDPLVYAFWHTLLNYPAYLISRIESEPPTLSRFWIAKHLCANCRQPSIPMKELAWAFFLLNRTCFSGIISANPICGKNGTDQKLSVRWNADSLIQRIRRISAMSSKIDLFQMDCCDFLEQYAYWYPNSTCFIDPPYVAKGAELYTTCFQKKDHERLAFTLESLYTGMPGADLILTYDDCPMIRNLYQFASIEMLPCYYSISRQRIEREGKSG